MNKRILPIWLTVISMVILTFPISQAFVQGVAASSRSKTSFDLSRLAQERATTSHTWRVVPSPSPGGSSQLIAVAAISANDVRAVGSTNASKTLIEQWNGTNWSIVPSPNPGPSGNWLGAVAAISAGNVWAVGSDFNSNNVQVTLTEHAT